MKKLLISCLFVCSMCISQTGMVTDSGFGVWLNSRAYNIEYTETDPYYNLTFGYMMDNGVEIGLDYGLDEVTDGVINLDVNYHMKKDEGCAWVFGVQLTDVSEEWGDMGNVLNVGGYSSGLMHFGLEYDLDDTDFEFVILNFGKMWDLGGFSAGVGYRLYTEAPGEGWITVSLGSTF